jgi:hypothetical protein
MIVFLAGLMLAAFASPSLAAVTAVQDSTWTSWPSTIYYFSWLKGPDAPYEDGYTVYITAVDRYSLWINGKRMDTPAMNDDNPATIDSLKVTGLTQELFIAVKVENLGRGNGNGLLMDIKAGTDWLGTTTMKRRAYYDKVNDNMQLFPAIWYYYAGDIEKALGKSDWYKIESNDFFTDLPAKGFQEVIKGQLKSIDFTPDSHLEVIAGYYGGTETGATAGGGIALRRIDGENLAYKKPCIEEKMTDGNLELGYPYHEDPVGKMEEVFLQDYYLVTGMRLYTGGANPQNWLQESVRGFSALISPDDGTYTQVGVLSNAGESNVENGGYDYSEITFAPRYARFVRYSITEARDSPPHIGEIMVFGTGYAYSGDYISPWIDFGSPTELKNFSTVTWDGIIPSGTTITVQTQTMSPEGVESAWGKAHTEKSFDFDSPEPATKFRYKITLTTDGVHNTPVLKKINVKYSFADQPLLSGNASITPDKAPMGVDTPFVYNVNYNLKAGQDIKKVMILVPSFAVADSVFISETGKMLARNSGFKSVSSTDTLYVEFDNAIINTSGSGMDNLQIYFRTSLMRNVHDFESGVFNTGMNDNAGPLKLDKSPAGNWRVTTSSVMAEVLTKVNAVPKVFTPNGDGRNEFSVIEFTHANVSSAKETIKIFNTKGALVTTLVNEVLPPSEYMVTSKAGNAAAARGMKGYWDGKDEDSDLVPPGTYIYQVLVDTQDGEKIKTGTVTVAY